MKIFINTIPAIIFIFLLLINIKKVGRVFALSNFIYALYVISSLAYFIMYLCYDQDYYYNVEALSLIVLSNIFLITPLSNFEKHNNLVLSNINIIKFKLLCYFSIGLGLFSTLFYAASIGKLFIYGAREIRNTSMVLHDTGTLLSIISAFGFIMSPIIMFLGFYNMSKNILSKYFTILLIISSTAIIFYTLGVAGRDGIVTWIFCFIGLLCLFYPYLKHKTIKLLKKVIICSIIAAAPIFMFITNDRCRESYIGSTGFIVSYLGQSLYNFSYNIDYAHKTGYKNINYRSTLGLYYEIIEDITGNKSNFSIHVLNAKSNLLGFRGNKFSFYLGNFYPYKTHTIFFIIFILICYMLYKHNLKIYNGRVISSTRLLIALSWYMILIFGIFYFYYGNQYGNLYLLLPFILRLYLQNFKPVHDYEM